MPLQDDMQLISVDDHVIEPPGVWQDRLPLAMRDDGPRIVRRAVTRGPTPGGRVAVRGAGVPNIGLNAVAGKDRSEWGLDPTRYDDMLPGCYDPVARVADMDLDGVQAGLNFPTFPRFARDGLPPGEGPRASRSNASRRTTTGRSTNGARRPRNG